MMSITTVRTLTALSSQIFLSHFTNRLHALLHGFVSYDSFITKEH